MRSPLVPLVATTALLCAQTTAAEVLVVEQSPTPGAAFSQIHEAIAAAEDGDLILVRTGTFYDGFTIEGKSISVVADRDAHVPIWGPVVVRAIAADQRVVLDGLFQSILGGGVALTIEDCDGPVMVQDGLVQASSIMGLGSGEGVEVTNCADVAFVQTVIRLGYPVLGTVVPGVAATNSQVSMYGCTVDGGSGGLGEADGGAGVLVVGGEMLLSATEVRGGSGGSPFVSPCIDAGNGGPGVVVLDGGTLFTQDAQIDGGPGGSSSGCASGIPGQATVIVVGAEANLTSSAHQLVTNTPVREGEVLELTIAAPAGTLMALAASPDAIASPIVPGLDAALVPAPPFALVELLGVIPIGGELVVSLPVAPIGPDALEIFVQGVAIDASGIATATGGREFVLLDALL